MSQQIRDLNLHQAFGSRSSEVVEEKKDSDKTQIVAVRYFPNLNRRRHSRSAPLPSLSHQVVYYGPPLVKKEKVEDASEKKQQAAFGSRK